MSFVRFLVVLCFSLNFSTTVIVGDLVGERERADQRDARRERQEPVQRLEALATTPCVGGMAGIYPCRNIDLVAVMPLSSIGGGKDCSDLWGWTDPMTWREYAIVGRNNGTSFVDITDAENPVYLGNLPPHGANSDHHDIKVYSNHAYIVSEAVNSGVQVFDLTQLRNVTAPPVTFSETAYYSNVGSAHNIAINEDIGFAYVVGAAACSGGPHFVDLANPATPVFAGCHVETFYTHDTQCVVYAGPDPDHAGRNICVNSNVSRISVIDVTNHSNSFLISETMYSEFGYVHQGWLTEDHRYYLQGDEGDELAFGHNTRTRIFDMTNLDAPVLIGTFDHATAAIDHNLYTHEGYVYMANLRAGLRIMDLANIASGTLVEVGHFDIYPLSDGARFNGAWSVYPYFASGHVIVSGIEGGLFILRPDLAPDFELDVTPAQAGICDPGVDTADIQITDRNGYIGNVALTASGLPAGANASFTVDPVVVPGSSTLTLDASGGAPGTYVITITGDDGTISHDSTLQFEIADQVPGQPVASLPVDEDVDVPRTPTLQWPAAAQATSYSVEVATDPALGNVVYSAETATTSHTVALSLDPLTTYHWRVRASNPCGTGPNSATASFTTLDVPEILLVDDDDNNPDVRGDYTATLTALGRNFDIWDTNNTDDEPSAAALGPYKTVIWFSGGEYGGASGPDFNEEQVLTSWLDSARCLLISSQDYFYDHGLTDFMTSRLGLSTAINDVSQTSVNGLATYAGLGPYTFSFPYTNWTDSVFPTASAQSAFQGDQGVAGIEKDTGVYRTSFWGFGLEALPTAMDREAVLGAFLDWCDVLPTLDGDADGVTNENDCAPDDPTAWSVPSPAYGLTLSRATIDNLNWSAPLAPGATGVTYDVLRSGDVTDFTSASCAESGGTDTTSTDTATPAPDEVHFYLIRVQNSCGSTLGNAPPRSGATCP